MPPMGSKVHWSGSQIVQVVEPAMRTTTSPLLFTEVAHALSCNTTSCAPTRPGSASAIMEASVVECFMMLRGVGFSVRAADPERNGIDRAGSAVVLFQVEGYGVY